MNTPLYIPKPVKIPKFEIPTIEKIPFPNSVNVPRLPQPDYRPTTEKVSPNVKQPVYFPRPPWPPYPKPDTTDLTKPELVPNPDVKLPAPKPLPYPDTTVLPWPPREPGQPGGTKLGPLPGPPPHHNCRPYPVKQYFQHPWDECQVCVCQEFQAHGIVNIEVNCYTKPSCCIELPDLQPRLPGPSISLQNLIPSFVPDTSITTPGSVSEQGQLNILDKICEHKSFGEQFVNPNDNCRLCTCQLIGNLVYPVCKRSLDCTTPAKPLPLDSIVYIEPECRYKEPNQEYKNNCKLCTCQPVFIYVVATCKPTGECQLAPVDGENIFTDASAGSLPTSNINTQINPTPYPDNNLPSTEHYNLTLPNGYPMLSNNVGSENGLIFSSQFGSNNGLKGTNNQISNGGILNGYQGFGSSNYNGLTSSNNGLKNNFLSPNQYVPNNDGISSNYGLSNQEILSGYQGLGVLNNNIQNGLTSSNRYLSQNGLISSNNFGSSNYLGSQESLNGYQSLGSSNNGYLNSLTSSNNYGSHSLGSQVNENGYHQLGSFNRYEFLNGLRFHGGYPSVDLHNTHVTAQPFINHIHPISEVSSLNSLDIHGVPHYTSYTVHPEGVYPLALQQSALAKLKAALTSGAITPADRRSLPLTEYSLNSEQSQQPSANIAQRHVIASATSDESRSLESTMILPGNPNTDGGENSDESGDDTHTVGDAVAALINEGKAVTVSDESDSREGANEKHV